ncbi:MAG: response regulator [Polyangiaceae bacterium]|nr:response regulator [Polyangiaceae bacterium]
MQTGGFPIEGLPAPALALSFGSREYVCNTSFRSLAGGSASEGKLADLADILDEQALVAATSALDQERSHAVEMRIGPQGRRLPFRANAKRIDADTVILLVDDVSHDPKGDSVGLFERAPAMLYGIDPQGRIQRVSERWLERFGYLREEVLGRRSTEFLTEESARRAVEDVLPKFFREGRCDEVPYEMVCKSGEIVNVRLSATVERDAEGTIVRSCAVIADVTEELRLAQEAERARKLEKDMLQAQKMESLGLLAGGVAHDFNNLLVAIIGNADLALAALSPTSPATEMLHDISTASRHAADLCRQLLAYSGKGRFVVGRLDLSQSVREILQILEVSVGKGTLLRTDFSPRPTTIEGDIAQIRQVIMNLVSNAAESLGGKRGIVTVATGHSHLDAVTIAQSLVPDAKPGAYAWVEVSDTGVGMSAETQQRIFEPFFSTKGTGRGLGLAAVLGIVRGHQGTVRLYSEPGRGTSFKTFFPSLEGFAHASVPEERIVGGQGSVLVVDDQEFVRRTVRRALEEAGYEVATATDGDEAVLIFSTRPTSFKCVLLDVTMPGKGGVDTLRALRDLDATVPIVLTSGYNEQDALQDLVGRRVAGFLQKPFSLGDLLAAIESAATKRATP